MCLLTLKNSKQQSGTIASLTTEALQMEMYTELSFPLDKHKIHIQVYRCVSHPIVCKILSNPIIKDLLEEYFAHCTTATPSYWIKIDFYSF